jgi:threonine synthase
MGIWKYKNLKANVKKKYRLSLEEGDTPYDTCHSLSKKLHIDTVYIKREDKNPTGSFKDRQIAYQLSYHLSKGIKAFALSSSGNAAISLTAYGLKTSAQIDIFISTSIDTLKLKRLASVCNKNITSPLKPIIIRIKNITLHFSKHPRSDAIKYSHKTKAYNLRGSLDAEAINGYKTIAYELSEQCPEADAIFLPTSSGTSCVGIFEGFRELQVDIPQFHLVQTGRIHPIAKEFDKNFKVSDTSKATAICDRVAKRKGMVMEIIRKTNGFGWVISDREIEKAQNLAHTKCKMKISPDSALSIAGLVKALSMKKKVTKPILLLTGA